MVTTNIVNTTDRRREVCIAYFDTRSGPTALINSECRELFPGPAQLPEPPYAYFPTCACGPNPAPPPGQAKHPTRLPRRRPGGRPARGREFHHPGPAPPVVADSPPGTSRPVPEGDSRGVPHAMTRCCRPEPPTNQRGAHFCQR